MALQDLRENVFEKVSFGKEERSGKSGDLWPDDLVTQAAAVVEVMELHFGHLYLET